MKGYKIDFTTNSVTITKAFADSANEMKGESYEKLQELRAQGFIIKARTHASPKTKLPHPSVKQMRHYVSLVENSEEYMTAFEKVCEEATTHGREYPRIRKWFLNTFPNYCMAPELNENNRVIVTPTGHEAAALKIA